ncbi:MAG: metallophosphoesterase family protein [Pseudomonadota bacterium]
MKIQDLGSLDGPILLFGGIYSNFHALKALWDWSDRHGIPAQNRICTGDIAAYCADAAKCITFMMEAGTHVVAGNFEEQLASGALDCGCGFDDDSTCSLLSVAWYNHASAEVTDVLRTYMAELPKRLIFEHGGKRYAVIHGGASDISRFLWCVTPEAELEKEVGLLRDQVGPFDAVIAGHSGIPFTRDVAGTRWINAGAIGMPAHDQRASTWFAMLLDDGSRADPVMLEELHYDATAAQSAMIDAGLVQGYHQTLLSGIWPSEDTLPPEMRYSAAASG